ncbi:unnamed protein product [Rotaria magnacalcarata]|uniref:Cell wall hydrolase SleB domain-containing protein n=4 Tax=Rotaria magnacalcarata TaxID=392030 RepID=A0A816VWZ3_9BILA|nr:unnamed protein product [Rotaria magnacalcarata]CAF1968064.1 unnamed protein product [Rotaria magnacalcarata]CAF2130192.1 unnamed protein product [Rotaria magnacalcarata]CAF3994006.1 unnamed protein product [Rotaria magnacalcarata]CAF4120828.1 unnamed protein product [Rotaria magnacalcarata]
MVYPETLDDVDVLAHTVYGEALGESPEGQIAVAWVIRNRVAKGRNYLGKTIKDVCLKPYQFSCWNLGDANRQKLLNLQIDDKSYLKIRKIAEQVLNGALPDNTKGSIHYHANTIKPDWKKGKAPVVTIGNHLFYNDID